MASIANTKYELENKIREIEMKIHEKNLELDENDEKIKNIDILNDSFNSKMNQLRGQIVHSPDKMQMLLEQLKETLNSQAVINEDLEQELKTKEKQLKNLEFLTKLTNEYETFILDLEKQVEKFQTLNKLIYDDTETIHKKEKHLNETQSKIDNLGKSLNSFNLYTHEFHQKQKAILECREDVLTQAKEKYQNNLKKINEIQEGIKNQTIKNKSIEDKVSRNYL